MRPMRTTKLFILVSWEDGKAIRPLREGNPNANRSMSERSVR
jgi:hypothetical protein